MLKNKISVSIVSFLCIGVIGLAGCNNKSSDSDVISVETPATFDHKSDSSINDSSASTTYSSAPTTSSENSYNNTNNSATNNDNTVTPTYPDSQSKVSGGNTGNTLSGH